MNRKEKYERMALTVKPLIEIPTEVHAQCCGSCPSAQGDVDPECAQIMTMSPEEKARTVFPCHNRQEKLCRGYVDMMGLVELTKADILEACRIPEELLKGSEYYER